MLKSGFTIIFLLLAFLETLHGLLNLSKAEVNIKPTLKLQRDTVKTLVDFTRNHDYLDIYREMLKISEDSTDVNGGEDSSSNLVAEHKLAAFKDAATGPAICIILASYSGCDRYAAVAYFIASMALMGGFYSGMKVNALDLAPNYAGSLTAMINGTSTISGIITPYLIGLLTPDSTLVQWRTAFWVCFAVLVGTNVVYVIWADGKQQWWDDVRQYGYPANWKHGPLKTVDLDKEKNKKEKAVLEGSKL